MIPLRLDNVFMYCSLHGAVKPSNMSFPFCIVLHLCFVHDPKQTKIVQEPVASAPAKKIVRKTANKKTEGVFTPPQVRHSIMILLASHYANKRKGSWINTSRGWRVRFAHS